MALFSTMPRLIYMKLFLSFLEILIDFQMHLRHTFYSKGLRLKDNNLSYKTITILLAKHNLLCSKITA